jgi:hypothetical protein
MDEKVHQQEREAAPKQTERSYETGMDEVFKTVSSMTAANVKRTYDEFQQESLESIRRNRTYVDDVLHDSRNHANNLNNVALQALQNAVENANFKAKNCLDTANLVNKQAAAHRDIAIDREWNLDEVAALASTLIRDLSGTNVSKEAIEAAVAAAVAKAVQESGK